MTKQDLPSHTPERGPQGDPWHAFGYVVSGVALYGLVGWGADQWFGTSFLVAIGILFGAVLGIYLTISRFDALPRSPRGNDEQHDQQTDQPDPT